MKIDVLLDRLASPAQRAIQNAGIKTLEQLSKYSEKEIADLHGIRKNAIVGIKSVLKENGLALRKK
jgi:DNA-directed RNA polymerase alpha subunit